MLIGFSSMSSCSATLAQYFPGRGAFPSSASGVMPLALQYELGTTFYQNMRFVPRSALPCCYLYIYIFGFELERDFGLSSLLILAVVDFFHLGVCR